VSDPAARDDLSDLEIFVGEWKMRPSFIDPADAPRAITTFEWLAGKRFLLQRWEIDDPAAPDGIAVIGFDPVTQGLLQHYFDERGVARVYEMTLADRVWSLQRRAVAPDFSQRFVGRFSDDGDVIAGHWELSTGGSNWEEDFVLTYTRSN
jgi:hypothetical protein